MFLTTVNPAPFVKSPSALARKLTGYLGAATLACAMALPGFTASAAAITGVVSNRTDFTTDNLNGYNAWTVWGSVNDDNALDPSLMTWGNSVNSVFSALDSTSLTGNFGTGNGWVKYTYTDGLGSFAGSYTSADSHAPKGEGVGASITFTHTLLGGDETIKLVLQNTTAGADFSASLNGTELYSDSGVTYTAGSGVGYLTLHVTGNIGDAFSFTMSAPQWQQFQGISISSAGLTINDVPEPSTLALVFGAGALAILRRRRK